MINQKEIDLVVSAMQRASEKLLELYRLPLELERKMDGSPVTNADRASSEILMDALNQTPYEIMCEEVPIPEYNKRKIWNALWIVDPLDGTKGYIHKTDEFAIAVGLVVKGKPIFGAIADPCKRRIIVGNEDRGVRILEWTENDFTLSIVEQSPRKKQDLIRLVKSRSRQDKAEEWANEKLDEEKLEFIERSSALKFFDLLEGKADLYVRMLPSMEWDICAGHALLRAAGGEVLSMEDDLPLKYNKNSLFNPNFRAISPHFQRKELDLSN